MTTLAPSKGLTSAELALRPGRFEDDVERLLLDCERRGLVVYADGGWRLSARAEARFGRWLREMDTRVDGEVLA